MVGIKIFANEPVMNRHGLSNIICRCCCVLKTGEAQQIKPKKVKVLASFEADARLCEMEGEPVGERSKEWSLQYNLKTFCCLTTRKPRQSLLWFMVQSMLRIAAFFFFLLPALPGCRFMGGRAGSRFRTCKTRQYLVVYFLLHEIAEFVYEHMSQDHSSHRYFIMLNIFSTRTMLG